MDQTLKDLEKILNQKAWDKEDHKLIAHALICLYNTVKELADGKGTVSVQSDVQSTKRRSSNKK